MTKNLTLISILLNLFLLPVGHAQSPTPSEGAHLKRSLSIRGHEIFNKRRLRLYVVFDESDSDGRYLINTLDGRSFKLFGKDANDAPLDVQSLSTVATKSPAVLRETALLFESSHGLSKPLTESIQRAVASFLGGFRSDVLTVRMGNEETSVRLAWVSPGQSENPRAIQRSILDAPVVAGTRGLTSVVCSGIGDLGVTQQNTNASLVQRNVVIISSEMNDAKGSFSDLRRCLSDASKLGARIFWVRLKSASQTMNNEIVSSSFSKTMTAGVQESKGFVSNLPLSGDPLPALNNIRSYLDDEYVLEFDLDKFKPYSDTIELELTANYHGHVVKSDFFKAEGFEAQPTPEDLARLATLQEAARRKDIATVVLLLGVFSLTGIIFWWLLKKREHVCGDCLFVVARNFQDCPFRNSKCYGRLSVIQGPQMGKVFPLFSGENTLGRKRSCMIRLKGQGISREHAKIVLSKRKALYTPFKGSESRINGVRTIEPRLLGSGSVIRLGDLVCRVDFKEGE